MQLPLEKSPGLHVSGATATVNSVQMRDAKNTNHSSMVASSPFWVHFWLAAKTGSYTADSEIPVRQLSQSRPCSGFVHVAERYRGTTDRPAGGGCKKMAIHYRCVHSNTNTRRADPRVNLPFPFALACKDDCHGWVFWDSCSDKSLICLVERRLHHQYPM